MDINLRDSASPHQSQLAADDWGLVFVVWGVGYGESFKRN